MRVCACACMGVYVCRCKCHWKCRVVRAQISEVDLHFPTLFEAGPLFCGALQKLTSDFRVILCSHLISPPRSVGNTDAHYCIWLFSGSPSLWLIVLDSSVELSVYDIVNIHIKSQYMDIFCPFKEKRANVLIVENKVVWVHLVYHILAVCDLRTCP